MGHKVNPKVFRLKVNKTWNSKWFRDRLYASSLQTDVAIRKYLEKKLREASLEKVVIDRSVDAIEITIHTARPGMIIGKGGAGTDELKNHIIKDIIKSKKTKININIKEVNDPNLSANIVALNVALDLEKRMPYRRVMKKYIENVVKAGAQGVKIVVAGRLGGVEIARTEKLLKGKIPLSTIRADIDYARTAARTTYGAVGVKVWIYKGEVFGNKSEEAEK
ncbi:30S ribosomal protein S3 [Candidatus Kuenenbacteria bacterium RIFCSPHIGHO2_02_FULL_39_13]|uniref:Small ribosomal subunit protein uS3 n=1 Tax=Candidatus Kuenenbacteria bacterium RIFCSPHIGHO2_02_FULL_39_13 TaxID=1798561 RepID=A0A1F6FNU8_9BACT|nr:MAG: 30S ribosomal protein S3 [Candidatus Kuenenbacteria bacterium RIFCSPHIGHO2_02_FULL_39_13]